MRKEVIKCDCCDALLDYEHSSYDNCEFYNISRQFIHGWAAIDRTFGESSTFQICKNCFNEKFGLKR